MKNDIKYVSGYMTKWLLIAIIVGVTGGLSAYVLKYLITTLTEQSDYLPIWLAPIIGGLLVSLLTLWDNKTTGFGTDHYLQAGSTHPKHLGIKNSLSKVLSTSITIGFKGSGGVEGPMLVVGGGIAEGVSKIPYLGKYITREDYRTLVICGAAGAIGAIFKSPLGGGIFVVELLYRSSLHYSDLFPAMLSSMMGYMIFALITNSSPLYSIPSTMPHARFFPLFVAVGVLSSLVALLFMAIFKRITTGFRLIPYPRLRPLIGGALTGIVLLFIPDVGGLGSDIIQNLITSNVTYKLLLLLLVGKIIATSFTIGSGGSGGLVVPALFIGAISGNLIAGIFPGNDALSVSLATAGMAASLAAIANVPVAASIMLIEMSGLQFGVPIIIGSIIGYLASHHKVIYSDTTPEGERFLELKKWKEIDLANDND